MSGKPVKVMFADDAPALSERLAELLSDLPIEVVAFALDGKEALRLFSEHEPDVAVVDLQMPGMNGFQVVSAIRRQGSRAVLILLTNFDSPEFNDRALRAGADHFLSKRTQFETVRDIVEDYLAGHA